MIAFFTLLLLVIAASAMAFLVLRDTSSAKGSVQTAPTVIDFGDQDLGKRSAVQTVTLTNQASGAVRVAAIGIEGSQPNDFRVTDETTCAPGRSIEPNASCTIGVRFRPAERAPRSATLVVRLQGQQAPFQIELLGTGVGSAAVVVETTRLDFGSVLIGESRTRTVGLTNAGNAPLSIRKLAVRGGGGSLRVPKSATTCTTKSELEAGGTCTIAIRFAPATTGAVAATLVIAHDAPGSPSDVELRGTGVGTAAPELNVSSLDLGEVAMGASSDPRSATLSNVGTGSLTLASVAITGSNPTDFSLTSRTVCKAGQRLGPGASCMIEVVFTPSAVGDRSATVEVRAGSDLIASLALSGVAKPAGT